MEKETTLSLATLQQTDQVMLEIITVSMATSERTHQFTKHKIALSKKRQVTKERQKWPQKRVTNRVLQSFPR